MESVEVSKSNISKRYDWSLNKFAWVYAVLILIPTLILGFIFKMIGVYESMAFRSINLIFIVGGLFLLLWDYKRVKNQALSLLDTFLLCGRTGIYFCLLYLPVIILFLSLDKSELALVKSEETFNSDMSILEIVLTSGFESIATFILFGLIASYIFASDKKPV